VAERHVAAEVERLAEARRAAARLGEGQAHRRRRTRGARPPRRRDARPL